LLTAQDSNTFSEKEQQLLQLSKSFIKDSIKTTRIESEKAFSQLLASTLKQENSFAYAFEQLETVSLLYPADSTFRIFTWQLYVDKNDYQYGGLIQMNNADNQIFTLNDQSADLATYDMEYEILSPENWYGAVYFNLHEFDSKEGKKYLLFGYDGFEFFQKRKVLEALYFDESGQPQFGAPVFAKVEEGFEPTTKNRLYMEYSAEVAAKLNYDEYLGIIIKDHLITSKSRYKGVGNVKVPDGSYEGYQLKEGVWVYVDKVFDLVSEEPPAPNPVLEKRKNQDLFGKVKKKKKKKG
jgi:hypothetical protein